jgi:hypothetical protein
LLTLLGALVGYTLWILYCRVALEVLAAVFRIANAVAPRGRKIDPLIEEREPVSEDVAVTPFPVADMSEIILRRLVNLSEESFGW